MAGRGSGLTSRNSGFFDNDVYICRPQSGRLEDAAPRLDVVLGRLNEELAEIDDRDFEEPEFDVHIVWPGPVLTVMEGTQPDRVLGRLQVLAADGGIEIRDAGALLVNEYVAGSYMELRCALLGNHADGDWSLSPASSDALQVLIPGYVDATRSRQLIGTPFGLFPQEEGHAGEWVRAILASGTRGELYLPDASLRGVLLSPQTSHVSFLAGSPADDTAESQALDFFRQVVRDLPVVRAVVRRADDVFLAGPFAYQAPPEQQRLIEETQFVAPEPMMFSSVDDFGSVGVDGWVGRAALDDRPELFWDGN